MRLVTAGHKPRTAAEMVLCVFSSGTKPCKTTISSSKCFLNDIALFNEQDARFHVGVLVRLEAERVDGSCVSNCCWCKPGLGFGFAGICEQGACTCDI